MDSNQRVHPPLPDPRAARRVPSHPSLRPLRQCQLGRQYHWPAGFSAYPSRPHRARTAMGPIVVAKTKSRTFVLAAAGAWSSPKPSNLAASLGSGPPHRSGSTAHDHNALAASPHHSAWSRPISRRQRPRSTNRNHQRPRRPPKRRSLGATSPSRSRSGRPIATPRYRRSRHPCSQSPDQIKYRRQIPID
jgi:hypothetical protein